MCRQSLTSIGLQEPVQQEPIIYSSLPPLPLSLLFPVFHINIIWLWNRLLFCSLIRMLAIFDRWNGCAWDFCYCFHWIIIYCINNSGDSFACTMHAITLLDCNSRKLHMISRAEKNIFGQNFIYKRVGFFSANIPRYYCGCVNWTSVGSKWNCTNSNSCTNFCFSKSFEVVCCGLFELDDEPEINSVKFTMCTWTQLGSRWN